jgi:hypothetical protein
MEKITDLHTLNIKIIKIKIYRIVAVPAISHGCETWYVILREEYRLKKVFMTKR